MLDQLLIKRLRDQGFRLTQVRQNLVEYILSYEGHWTIQEMIELVKKKWPSIGQATLYRTVSLLHQQGLLLETRLGSNAARYEVLSNEHHDHLTCQECGEIFEFENKKIEELQEQIARELGFKLSDHRMELFGKCLRRACTYKKSRL